MKQRNGTLNGYDGQGLKQGGQALQQHSRAGLCHVAENARTCAPHIAAAWAIRRRRSVRARTTAGDP